MTNIMVQNDCVFYSIVFSSLSLPVFILLSISLVSLDLLSNA